MAVSTSALIPRVRTSLGETPFATQGSAASASSVVAVTDGTDWEEGAVGEFQDDGEQFKVISVSSNNLTCFRGWNGTTGATHAASTTILREFNYSYKAVSEALTQALNRLWPYAWKVETDTLTVVTGTTWYNLTATQWGIIEASQTLATSPAVIKRFGVDGLSYEFRRNIDTAVCASGVGIRFPDGLYHASNDVDIRSAARITGTSDIEDSTTLPVGDALVTGALAYLSRGIAMQEIREPGSRAKIGQASSVFGILESEFRAKLTSLHATHMEMYPILDHTLSW